MPPLLTGSTGRPRAARATPPDRLSGTVEHVVFHNPDNGFCVVRLAVTGRREPVTVVGKAATIAPGEVAECEGEWVTDRTHGLQFKAASLRLVPPSTLEGIEKYLASGMVRGIGPHFARKLVRAFGEDVFEVIEHDPDRLTELPGIGPKRRDRVVEAWAEQRAVRDIMIFLQSHGVGTARAVRIYKTYGDQAVDRVRENPYRLALDIHGIGFQTADRIARSLGIEPDAIERVRAGVRHTLQQLAGQGHCAAERGALAREAAALLEVEEALAAVATGLEVEEGNLIAERFGDEEWIYLAPLAHAERGVAAHLLRIGEGEPPWGAIDTDRALPWVEERSGLSLSPSQREAVARAVNGKLTVITGGPGVGKTTVLDAVLRIVRAKGARVTCCAPTGRAAKRLSESVGLEAKTIHRLLEFDPATLGFRHDADDPLDTDLVVVDEVSMVDVVLANQLLRAVGPRTAVLLVGDVDQLPSVGPGAVLAEVIDSGRVPTARLTEIFRQAARSRIVTNAHRINRGEMPERVEPGAELSDFYFVPVADADEAHEKLLHIVTERIPRRFGLDPVRDTQVLTPVNRGGLGARALNVELQGILNRAAEPSVSRFGWTYAAGDKVLQTVNNYDKDVFNGDVGRVLRIDAATETLLVDFDGREVTYEPGELDELSLAYAMTVHKSQGSEYPAVVIPLVMQHYTLLQRNLVYTGVTRGRSLVVLVAEPRALAMAVKSAGTGRRASHLAERLRAG